jgi:cytochrome c oxidase assembly protein subunit 15
MVLALLLVAILIVANHRSVVYSKSKGVNMDVPFKVEYLLIVGLVLMSVQVVLGTQVREQIDQVATDLGFMLRGEWVERVGLDFLIHRSFSLVLLSVHVLYFFWAFKFTSRKTQISIWSQALIILIILEIASGVGMAYFGIPAFLQPIHLLVGALIIGVQVILILQFRAQRKIRLKSV